MKIAIFSPYWRDQVAGGGEKHLLEIALVLAQKHQVSIAIAKPNQILKDKESAVLNDYQQFYERFLGKSLAQLNWCFTPLMTSALWLSRIWWTGSFDAIFAVTDGSLFFSLAKQNYLHFQVPFTNFHSSLLNRAKLNFWPKRNANSQFTKKHIERIWGIEVQDVLYPLIDGNEFSPTGQKKHIILSVGRFYRQLHNKRQDVLIDAFRKLCKSSPELLKDWKLILAGTVEDEQYLRKLKLSARGLPIEFQTNITRKQLVKLYESASFYWHAAGYGNNLNRQPELAEHFGIATAEAMAAGALPLVFWAGGQVEVLGKNLKDLGWKEPGELLSLTKQYLTSAAKMTEMVNRTKTRVSKFDRPAFEAGVWKIFK